MRIENCYTQIKNAARLDPSIVKCAQPYNPPPSCLDTPLSSLRFAFDEQNNYCQKSISTSSLEVNLLEVSFKP